MRLSIILVLALVVLATASLHKENKEYRHKFRAWIEEHGKTYAASEFHGRYKTWKANHQYIEAHNAKEEKTFTLAMNHMGDLASEEYKAIYLGFNISVPKSSVKVDVPVLAQAKKQTAPASWDWRTKGAVTAIKNQGQCGSCWSFSAAESIEGCHFLTTGTLVALSEQNLMDCSRTYGNQGCNGGLMDQAFEYVIHNGGIDTEASYPYRASTDFECEYKAADCGSTVTSYKDVPSGSESALESFVYAAPTSVAIDASHQSFQFYSSGVYYEPECSSTQLDHGVLAVGYGSSTSDYWIVKNSWGPGWGDAGYIMMSRNKNNNCGIATTASRPLGCNNCS